MSKLYSGIGVFMAAALLCALPLTAQVNANTKYANPDTSVNFLTLYQNSNRGNDTSTLFPNELNGFYLQEAEMQFFSDVDPYFHANALLSISQDSPTSDFGIDPEEVFVETIDLSGMTFKLGKFKTALDRHNTMHTHAFPFIDAPLIDQELVGDSLSGVGVSGAFLMPTDWFMELTVQEFQGTNSILYDSPDRNSPASLVHLRNLWDLTEETTMDWGVSGTEGNNQYGSYSQVYGSDLTFKWRPLVGGKYNSMIWNTECLWADLKGDPNGEFQSGMATWVQYQFAELWWIQARFEDAQAGVQDISAAQQGIVQTQKKESVLLALLPSEFSGFRLQYDHLEDGLGTPENKVSVQMNITIGAHPAHSY